MKNLAALFVFIFVAIASYAQQLKLKNGEEFAVETVRKRVEYKGGQPDSTDELYRFKFKMLNKGANECKLECVLLCANVNYRMTEDKRFNYIFNSDSIRRSKLKNLFELVPAVLLLKPFTVIVDTTGKLIRTEGVDQLMQQSIDQWHITARAQPILKTGLDAFVLPLLKNVFLGQPESMLHFQSEWTDTFTGNNYKVTTIMGALLNITATNTATSFKAKYILNDVNGLLESSETTSELENEKLAYSQRIIYGKNTDLTIDTAWLNMAVGLSYWSNGFNTLTGDIDSAKAIPYFNAHDTLYHKDAYYAVRKLYMYQHLNLNSKRNVNKYYNALLEQTPNALLKGETYNLSNKLNSAVRNGNADAAYDLIRYYYKDPYFLGWLSGNPTIDLLSGANEKTWHKLLPLLIADKTMHLQPHLTALNLWLAAKDNKGNDKVVQATVKGFINMKDEYVIKGNAPYFELLTYKILINSNKQNQADALLDHTIETLERLILDTIKSNPYIFRNRLAHAYYFKYQRIAISDSVKALPYLAKAANYSPVSIRQRRYVDPNDNIILGAKDNYREEYMGKLFDIRDNQAALSIFIDNINNDIAQLDDMQKIYQLRFADKDFKKFFQDHIVTNWVEAPDFEMITLDGNKHTLADYKDKWLVIDFWGTWCGPCRDEMPEINSFNAQINAGKYPGVALLTVACNDEKTNVKNYLKGSKFNLPVSMDENIASDYRIGAFPTKVLIAPNGKMIRAASVPDLKGLISKLNDLYPAN